MYSHVTRYKEKRKVPRKSLLLTMFVMTVLVVLLIKILVAFPVVQATTDIRNATIANSVAIPWPAYGQSAVAVKGYGVIASSPNQTAKPMASVAKVVTALAVLEQKPLQPSEKGDSITITEADVQIYDYYQQRQGVVVDIKPGATMSEYEALQYMLIVSANNIADITAQWAFGSTEAYLSYANNMLAQYGLSSMHVDDASGLSPKTVASAADLVRLGELALDNAIISEIVAQESINLPDGTRKINTNVFLNYENNGVVGIKNGLTDEAGGVLLAAAKKSVNSKDIVIITVVMGSERYFDAQKDAIGLIEPTVKALSGEATIESGTVVGYYDVPWMGMVPIKTKEKITLDSWTRALDESRIRLRPLTYHVAAGDSVGTIIVPNNDGKEITYEVILDSAVAGPSAKWRAASIF